MDARGSRRSPGRVGFWEGGVNRAGGPHRAPGQHPSQFLWQSASGWAEGAFVSAMKRVGQALETRKPLNIQQMDAELSGKERIPQASPAK